jgi:hypothetical protein
MARKAGGGRAVTRREAPSPMGDENLQSGGTRGTSKQGGPRRDPVDADKDARVRMNTDDDAGSRSSLGRPDPEERAGGEEARDTEPPRGKLPPGTTREDYVGGERPHKTRKKGGTPGASGRRNEVI